MKKIKILTITLLIILITLISFLGIYVQTQNRMENKVKGYTFSKEIDGGRVVELQVIKEENDEEKTDETKEETTDETSEETEEVEKVQTAKPEDLTPENFEIVKNTIEKRLNNLGAEDYTVSLNKENGNIIVEFLEDNNTDTYTYYLTASRKVLLTEKDSENYLLTDDMVEEAQYTYTSTMEGIYKVRIELKVNEEGQAKLEEIRDDYAVLSTEVEEIEKEISRQEAEKEKAEKEEKEKAEKTENADAKEVVEETENKEDEDNKEETITKKIAVLTIGGNEYEIDKIEGNKITVIVGADTSRTANINNNIAMAAEVCMLIESGAVPVDYEILSNRYIHSEISENHKMYFVATVAAIFGLILLVLIIKYRTRGLLAAISFIGFVSLFLLILRYTNVLISIEGILAIIITFVINLVLNIKILSRIKIMHLVKEAVYGVYKDVFIKIIPIVILSITFCFAGWSNLNSFGMIMFWGLVLTAAYNVLVTKTLLELKENK